MSKNKIVPLLDRKPFFLFKMGFGIRLTKKQVDEISDELIRYDRELREQIAQEIEAYKSGNSVPAWIRVDKAAAIARGTR